MTANRRISFESTAVQAVESEETEFWVGNSTLASGNDPVIPLKGKKNARRRSKLNPAHAASSQPLAVPSTSSRKVAVGADHRRLAAAALFSAGFGYKFVSTALGISLYTVRTWLRQWKQNAFTIDTRVKKGFPQSVKERVYKLRRQGLSWTDISEATGASRTTCRNWCMKEEIEKGELKR